MRTSRRSGQTAILSLMIVLVATPRTEFSAPYLPGNPPRTRPTGRCEGCGGVFVEDTDGDGWHCQGCGDPAPETS